jgi:hypothetical protein
MVASNGLFQSVHNYEVGVRVEQALLSAARLRSERVSAVAFCGIVELSGTVSSQLNKVLAIRIARQISGVTTVVESLRISNPANAPRANESRETAIHQPHGLHWQSIDGIGSRNG